MKVKTFLLPHDVPRLVPSSAWQSSLSKEPKQRYRSSGYQLSNVCSLKRFYGIAEGGAHRNMWEKMVDRWRQQFFPKLPC